MSFSATDAAFEGFRIVRRAPLTILFWSLIYCAAMAVAFMAIGPTLAGLMARTEALQGVEPSMADLEALGRSFAWVFAVALPVMLAAGAVINAAIARAVLSPRDKALGYVRLGADELRVLATSLIVMLVVFVVMMALYLLVGGLGVAAMVTGQGWIWLFVVLGGLGAVAVMIWLSVRLSLAVPIAVAEKRIAPFASFAASRGHFWALLGMALLAGVMSLLVSLLFGLATTPLTLMTGNMETLAVYEGQTLSTILTAAWPMLLVSVLINGVSTALQAAITYAPFTAAYAAIKGLNTET